MALFIVRKSGRKRICSRIVSHRNLFSQGTGLMLHRKIHDEAHIFPFRKKKIIALTMWFVFFPIDVLYLDNKKKVVEIKKNFKPFTNYFPNSEASYVVELPVGTVSKFSIKSGEVLEF